MQWLSSSAIIDPGLLLWWIVHCHYGRYNGHRIPKPFKYDHNVTLLNSQVTKNSAEVPKLKSLKYNLIENGLVCRMSYFRMFWKLTASESTSSIKSAHSSMPAGKYITH